MSTGTLIAVVALGALVTKPGAPSAAKKPAPRLPGNVYIGAPRSSNGSVSTTISTVDGGITNIAGGSQATIPA